MGAAFGTFNKRFFSSTTALACAAFFGQGGAVAAQAPNPIQHCRENAADKDAQIACLEAALTALMGSAAETAQTVPAPNAAVAVTEAPAELTTPAAVASARSAGSTALASAEQAADEVAGIGAEQVERRLRRSNSPEERRDAKEEKTVKAGITEYATSSLGKLILFLDNGQVWRQRSSDRNKIRLSNKRDYTVEISEGMISGYRIHINEVNRTIVAERIQ